MASENEKVKPLCDYDQYALLLMCVEEGNFSEWNKWRETNPDQVVILGGVDFQNAVFSSRSILQWLFNEGPANLEGVYLSMANLQGADLSAVNLQKAQLGEADLRDAKLETADLRKASFHGAWLNNTELRGSRLNGVSFNCSHLEGAQVRFAQLDSETLFENCRFDKKTDFTSTDLEKAGIDPGLKAAFRNNIRRIHWQNWLKKNPWWKKILINPFARFFWHMTDYGTSTIRIILWFVCFAIGFGVLYHFLENAGLSVVSDLAIKEKPWLQLLRSMYFSVVTMTTLGLGDIYAQKSSYLGHALLMVQVILGYVLLGALVTRLGVLFTSEAPAAAPTPAKEMVKEDD
jgi:hypothetical protein